MKTSKPHVIRLNPTDEALLNSLIENSSSSELSLMLEEDRSHREGYRNHSGRQPTAHSLILRRAISIGLNVMTS